MIPEEETICALDYQQAGVLCSCLVKSSVEKLFDIININSVLVDICPFKHLHEFSELQNLIQGYSVFTLRRTPISPTFTVCLLILNGI